MIVGGATRGLRRATHYSLCYMGAYMAAGFPMVCAIGMQFKHTELGDLSGFVVLLHFLSFFLLWPAAVVLNFAILRLFRPRRWRGEPWRPWVAGVLGVPFCWGGSVLWATLVGRPPEVATRVAGEWGAGLYLLGLPIFFSNMALVVAWILPVWNRGMRPLRAQNVDRLR